VLLKTCVCNGPAAHSAARQLWIIGGGGRLPTPRLDIAGNSEQNVSLLSLPTPRTAGYDVDTALHAWAEAVSLPALVLPAEVVEIRQPIREPSGLRTYRAP
jgi:hypothetical protein